MRRRLLKRLGAILLIGVCSPLFPAVRTVRVRIIADEEFRAEGGPRAGEWAFAAARRLAAVSREFERRFGIRFRAAGIGGWVSPDGRSSLSDLIQDLAPASGRGRADVLVGFTAQGGLEREWAGISSYGQSLVLVRTGAESSMRRTLKHELCHVFGAIDLLEPGSIMDVEGRVEGGGLDEFTAGLVLLHKNRTFGGGEGFRGGIDIDAVLALCLERVSDRPAELPVLERIAHLCLAKKDYVALERMAARVLGLDPSRPEMHNLLGIARTFLGDEAGASVAFEEAVRLRPRFADAYLNLAACALRKNDPDRAEACFRRALEIRPGSGDAHRFLGFLLESRNRMAEAVSHYQEAIRIDPRLTRELGSRIRKLS